MIRKGAKMVHLMCPQLPCVESAEAEWGTLAEWATVVIALLALAAAALSAWFAHTASIAAQRQADAAEKTLAADVRAREEAQPRKVYAFEYRRTKSDIGNPAISLFGGALHPEFVWDRALSKRVDGEWEFTVPVLHIGVEVHNLSEEIVGPIALTLVDTATGVRSAARVDMGVMFPHDRRCFELIAEITDGYDTSLAPDDILPSLQPVLEFRDSGGQWWSRVGVDPIKRSNRGTYGPP